ncbi:hypothetical protein [Salinibacter grassmerensis]|uniref:hypothetical protein n=1 Tax=Salinibacter grassmerensis TaxID=3040353 RepID=UPI0021E6FBC8|nr:hypothetical protein [Salinibacter grassmerensis]
MALDQDQKQDVVDYLQKHVQGGCTACGGDIRIEDHLVMPQMLEDGNTQMGAGIPSVVATCEDCGKMQLFAANVVGIDPQNA